MSVVSPPQARRFGRGHHQAVDVGQRLKVVRRRFRAFRRQGDHPGLRVNRKPAIVVTGLDAVGHRFAVGVFGTDRAQYAVCRTVLVVAEAVLTVGGAFKRRRVVIQVLLVELDRDVGGFTSPRPAASVAVTTRRWTLASASKSFAAAFAPSAVRVITPVFVNRKPAVVVTGLDAVGHRFAVGVFGTDRAQYAVCRTVLVVAEAVLTVGGAFKRRRVVIQVLLVELDRDVGGFTSPDPPLRSRSPPGGGRWPAPQSRSPPLSRLPPSVITPVFASIANQPLSLPDLML